MSKRARTQKEQSRHDKKVELVAKEYEMKGYQVKADDIQGFTDPDSYRKRVPDVVAKKNGHITLVEVETENSVDTKRDRKQRKKFKQWASRKTNRHFRRVVV